MKKEFLELDFDGDGTISTKELETALYSLRIKLKLTESDIHHTLQEIDKDGNGTIDLNEYYKYMRGNTGTHIRSKIIYRALFQLSLVRKEFQIYDLDGSGYITKDELLQVIHLRTGDHISDQEGQHLFEDIDLNKDGKINYEEFVFFMTK